MFESQANHEIKLSKFEIPIFPKRSLHDLAIQDALIQNPFDFNKYSQLLDQKINTIINRWASPAMQARMAKEFEKGECLLFKIFLKDWEELYSSELSIWGKDYFYAGYQNDFNPTDSNYQLFEKISVIHVDYDLRLNTNVIRPLSKIIKNANENETLPKDFLDKLVGSDFGIELGKKLDPKYIQVSIELDEISLQETKISQNLLKSARENSQLKNGDIKDWVDYMQKALEIYDSTNPENEYEIAIVRYLRFETDENIKLIKEVLEKIDQNSLLNEVKSLNTLFNFSFEDAFGPIIYTENDGDLPLSIYEQELLNSILIEVAELIHPKASVIVTKFQNSKNYSDLKNSTDKTKGLMSYNYYRNLLAYIAGSIPTNGLATTGLAHELGHYIAQILNNENYSFLQSGSYDRTFAEVPSILFQLLFIEKLKKIERKTEYENVPTIYNLNRDICRSIIIRYISKCLFEIDFLNKIESINAENIESKIQTSYEKFFKSKHPEPDKLLNGTLQRLLNPQTGYNYLTSLMVVFPLVEKIVSLDFILDENLTQSITELIESAGIVNNSKILKDIKVVEALKSISKYISDIITQQETG